MFINIVFCMRWGAVFTNFSNLVFTVNGKFLYESEYWESMNMLLTSDRNGILCIILCLALGIANIFHFSIVIIFSIIAM